LQIEGLWLISCNSSFFIMKRKPKKEFKLISFLDGESLANLNTIVKHLGIKYTKKNIRKPVEEKIDYKKLMEAPPGFDKRDGE